MRIIKNVSQLRKAIADGHKYFRVCLRWGLYSRKTITLTDTGRFHIVNHIDETESRLTAEELSESNIGVAMRQRAFVAEEPNRYQL